MTAGAHSYFAQASPGRNTGRSSSPRKAGVIDAISAPSGLPRTNNALTDLDPSTTGDDLSTNLEHRNLQECKRHIDNNNVVDTSNDYVYNDNQFRNSLEHRDRDTGTRGRHAGTTAKEALR